MENPIGMDELAVPLFQETSMYSDVVSGEHLDKNPSETVFGVFFGGSKPFLRRYLEHQKVVPQFVS